MKRTVIAVSAIAALMTAGQVLAADGKAVFEKSCKGCHTMMKPKMGDKAAWAPLIKQGEDALVAAVMKGMKPMPPKGGAGNEDDVKAAVHYMVEQNK